MFLSKRWSTREASETQAPAFDPSARTKVSFDDHVPKLEESTREASEARTPPSTLLPVLEYRSPSKPISKQRAYWRGE